MNMSGTGAGLSAVEADKRQGMTTVSPKASGTAILTALAVVAALYVGRDVFLPLAVAMLVAFALSPLVTRLRSFGLPMIASVLAVVTFAFAMIGGFMLVVVGQISQLVQQLPTFQTNIVTKLNVLQAAGSENGLVARLTQMVTAINAEITTALPTNGATASGPMTVEVIERRGIFQTMLDITLQLVSPVAMAGLVVIVVVFMLLARDELRDRFIRLVGANDINRTTQVIEDAGARVGMYLLIQLLVNIIYAIPIGFGLWMIGVPNALLWGMVTLVVRFVPYIGPLIAAIFPLFLAFAVSPNWSMVLWTAALFAVVEFITSNMIEPWLYGSRTGVNPLGIIVAAIFWTWLWGPLGLVLSTPLTVCLVVVGRYIPQFEAFDVLFGDQPVLAAHSRLYQRLLVGDTVESTQRAEETLEEDSVADYHRDVGIPALLLAQADYARGVLSKEQESRFADTATYMLDEIEAVVAEELAAIHEAAGETPVVPQAAESPAAKTSHAGQDARLVVLGGRTRLDDLAARMLAQALSSEGGTVQVMSYMDLTSARFARVVDADATCIILNFLDTAPSRASLLHIPRLKRAAPDRRVGLVLWQSAIGQQDGTLPQNVSAAKLAEITKIGADFCVTSMDAALTQAFSDDAPRPPIASQKKVRPARKPVLDGLPGSGPQRARLS